MTTIIYESKSTLVELMNDNCVETVRKTVKPPRIGHFEIKPLAAYLCSREVSALRKLQGLKGFQQLVMQDSGTSFISLYEKGVPIKKAHNLTPEYFAKLDKLVEEMHKAGVVDMDLGHTRDILIDESGNPTIIDFGGAVVGSSGFFGKLFFGYMQAMNHRYVLRKKKKYLPSCVTAEDEKEIRKIGALPAAVRKMKECIRGCNRSFNEEKTL